MPRMIQTVLALILLLALGGSGCDRPDAANLPNAVDAVDAPDAAEAPPRIPEGTHPVRKTLHRLNRAEYTNTIRALFYGLETDVADGFPSDDHGAGFDNIADLLVLSPIVFELMEHAAEDIVTQALHVETSTPDITTFEAESSAVQTNIGHAAGPVWRLTESGDVQVEFHLPTAGLFVVSAQLGCIHPDVDKCRAALQFDGWNQAVTNVGGGVADLSVVSVELFAEAGPHTMAVAFLNGVSAPDQTRDLLVDWLRVEGPTDVDVPKNAIRDQILALCVRASPGETACLREIADDFGKRAWRRPLIPEELDGLMALMEVVAANGSDWDHQLSVLLKAFIVSPHFLFRVELDSPDATSLTPHLLTDHELASRLAYFLWSSMPDAELLSLADQGLLQDQAVIAAQVERMLKDAQSFGFVENFAGQWLFSRAVSGQAPDPDTYPDYDDALKDAQAVELRAYITKFFREDRNMLELLTDSETLLNRRLAQHYGLPTDGLGDGFVTVDLTGTGRSGLLAKSGLMTVLAHPTRTSPAKRGRWVLEALMCDGPDDPPPGVEGLLDKADPTGKTLRELLEAHRTDPYCASCHKLIDPIGLGLENFDGIGAWRTLDNGLTIDPQGELPGGLAFSGPEEMAARLLADPRFGKCISRKVFIFAMGRGVVDADAGYLAQIEWAFEHKGYRFAALAEAIAVSDAFRMRRGESPNGGDPESGGTP